MTKEEKTQVIEGLVTELENNPNFYITDLSTLTAFKTSILRRQCFGKQIALRVVKNTLLKKAMERSADGKFADIIPVLKGNTAIMYCSSGSEPAKLIKEFRKTSEKPTLKAAFVEESVYIGDEQLNALASIKTKNELIGDIIGMLQAPAQNVISALQSGKTQIAGIVKTLSEKPE